MTVKRDEVIAATGRLLELQGYHATGLNQIIRESGAPKGSLYYYFPEGKGALAAEAIEQSGRDIAGNIARSLAAHDDPVAAIPVQAGLVVHTEVGRLGVVATLVVAPGDAVVAALLQAGFAVGREVGHLDRVAPLVVPLDGAVEVA